MYLRIALAALLSLFAGAAFAQSPEPLSEFQDCENCPVMVVMPQGSFTMGAATKKERGVAVNRGTVDVDIAYTFALGKFELTVGEFAAFADATGYDAKGPCQLRLPEFGPNKGKFIGEMMDDPENMPPAYLKVKEASFRQPGWDVTDRQPATCLSRNDMEAYLAWLSETSGRKYRFPSNAEWEYGARAGTKTLWFWGDKASKACAYANFADKKSPYQVRIAAPCSEKNSPERTAEVGSYEPNPWGLYDTAGNVLELVADCYTDSYKGAPTDGSPFMPAGNRSPANGDAQECAAGEGHFFGRGFQFDGPPETMVSAGATFATRADSANFIGLRVAVSLDGPAWDLK
jgi:formylglycine-generating enzyme required for sulfatase activity